MKLTNDLQKLATAGEDSIRIHSTNNLKVVDSIIPIADETAGGFRNLAWSDNGALLAALSNSGTLYVYLTELSVVGQSCGNRLGYLTSLSEVTVFEVGVKQTRKISMDLEPTFVGVGPYHLAAGMNNKAVFHSLEEDWKCTQEQFRSKRKTICHFILTYTGGGYKVSREFVSDLITITHLNHMPFAFKIGRN